MLEHKLARSLVVVAVLAATHRRHRNHAQFQTVQMGQITRQRATIALELKPWFKIFVPTTTAQMANSARLNAQYRQDLAA